MAKSDPLAGLNLAQLRAMRARVDEAISAASTAEKEELRLKIRDLIENAGYRVTDILDAGTVSGRSRKSAGAIRYRNPADPTQTWTGRGRRPFWLVEALKKGQSLAKFRA